MIDRNSIMSYDVCTCGAITLYLSNKTQVSLKRKNLKKQQNIINHIIANRIKL